MYKKMKLLKRLTAGLVASLLLTSLLTGCQAGPDGGVPVGSSVGSGAGAALGSSDSTAYYSFKDGLGNTIVLKEKPKKVAVLFSSYADVWQCAGGEVAVTVGESIERGFVDERAALVDSGAGKTIDNERLVAEEPDFVICSADLSEQIKTAELLNKAGIPCAAFHVENFGDYLEMLKICTDICENPEAYQTYGTAVQAEIESILAGVAEKQADKSPKKILFIRAGSKSSATKAKTAADHFACAMLKEMGTYNIAENAPVLLDGLSFEEVLSEQPDFIFISTMGKEEAARAYMDGVLAEASWQGLTAVQNGNYAYLPKALFQFKPNARWAEAYRYLAGLLYPEA